MFGLAALVVSGCSFGQAQSVSNITHNGAIVHGYVATDQPTSPQWITAVAPAPKIPDGTTANFDRFNDWSAYQCGTLGSPSTQDARARPVDAPLGDVAAAASFAGDPDCFNPATRLGRTGGLASDTTYNVRICALDSTHTNRWNCGGVISFTTDEEPG